MKPKTKKRLMSIGIIVAVLLITYIILAFLPRQQNYRYKNTMMAEGELPLLIAHGGGNKEFPDNTLEAFYNAYSVDKRVMMETDVSITKDNVVILSHDTTLDRKTNVTGNIADWNYSDLIAQKIYFGYTNPTDENDLLCGEREHFKDDHGNDHNLAVHYWTVNDKEEMKHLIDIGADGIMTDYPHQLKEVYQSYK